MTFYRPVSGMSAVAEGLRVTATLNEVNVAPQHFIALA
jgi:hypothetical protein